MKKGFHVLLFVLFAVLMSQSAWADIVSTNGAGVNVPCSGSLSVYVDDKVTYFYVYDDGGPSESYHNNCRGYLSISAPDGKALKVETANNMAIEDNRDTLRILNSKYMHTDLAGYYLESMLETRSPGTFDPLYTTGTGMAIQFASDGSITNSGFVLKVSVVSLYSVNLSSSSMHIWDPYLINSIRVGYDDYSSFAAGAKVSLYDRPLGTGSFLTSLKVKDASGNLLPFKEAKMVGDGYGGDSLQFTMPSSNVTVSPTYTDLSNLSSVDMLCRTATLNIPSSISSFKIYDNGGSSENYTNNCDAYLTLKAPAGFKIKLTGTVNTEEKGSQVWDYLKIYNGSTLTDANLLGYKYSTTSGVDENIGTATSSGNVMTLWFHSDNSNTYSGLNLTATLIPQTFSISKASYSNGSVSVASSANVGALVTITATPNSGYAVKSMTATTASGANVTVTKGSGNTWSFTMPGENMTIKPVFAKDSYAIAYKTASEGTASGVTSAKVGNTVAVTATPLNSTYLLKDISVVSSENVSVDVTSVKWYNNTAAFIMPFGNVSVTPVFTNNLSADGGLFINMPKSGSLSATIPAGVKSFKVYDDGGKDGNYSKSSNGTLVLTAPTGYVFELNGSVKTGYTERTGYTSYEYTCNSGDNLSVYDGSSTSATALVSGKIGCTSSSGPLNSSLDRIISRGNTMTLNFKSNATGYASAGLDLTVKLVKLAMDLADDGNGNRYVNMVAKHKATLTIPDGVTTFNVYDDGGKGGSYLKGVNDTLVLTAPPGYVLQVTGLIKTGYTDWNYSSYTCNANDNLSVYDGASPSATALLQNKTSDCTESSGPKNTSLSRLQSSGQSMTLVFKSNATGNASSGLDLTVKVVPVINQIVYANMNEGGSVSSSAPKTANIGAAVNYTYSYSSGYLVSDIKVVAENGDAVKASGGWYTNKKASFMMPPSNVTVKSTYTNDWSAEGGLYIDMPKTGTVSASIPAGVKSFKVYDDGGSSGNYSKSSNGTLELTAPTGYVLELTGNVKTGYTDWNYSTYTCNKNDNLSVASGNDFLVLLQTGCTESYGPSDHSLGRLVSRDNTMSFFFTSNATGTASSGLDLTVKLHKLAMDLADDGNGNRYVNMVAKHKATLTIPDGVTTFNVYDDGGKGGSYLKGVNDTLVLTAPPGYVLQVTGLIKTGYTDWNYSSYTCNANDNLSVYDGASPSATALLQNKTSDCTESSGPKNTSLSRLQSSGQSMTLVFKSSATGYSSSGLDLTVKLVKFAVAINSATGGTIVSSKYSAITNDVISLTATPKSDYMFSGVTVKDASENVIKSNNSSFTTAVFTMPASDVSVTPTFTNTFTAAGGLHLDFVRNKKNEVNIPSGVASFKIYDNGGKDKNYESSSRDTIVLKAPTGYRLTVTGNIKTEKGWDSLYVFDGANTDNEYKLFGASSATSNTETSVGSISSTGEYMTLRFKSDGSNEYEGLDLTVTLEKINYTITHNSVTGGTLNSKDADTLGAVVYLTGSPTASYHLSDVTVVDKDGNVIKSPIYSFERSKFTMPASNVTVTPTWTDNLTAEGGLHLDLLKNGNINTNIPAGVKSFNLYDNGGKNGAYESNSNDILTLNAPTGFYLVVTGLVTLERGYDSLYIFDGANTSAAKLFGSTSTSSGSKTDIGTITSSGRSLTFRFKSDGSTQYSGLNLVVSVEPITYGIAIADAANGRVLSDKTKAAKDSIVNLSWVYTTGYLIWDIDVKDASENKIAVNGGWYSGATASFVMPGSAVTVTPTFTNNLTAEGDDGLYINMPKTGTINAVIPAKVKSFKVYDDGGKNGVYSTNGKGTLSLTAPEGYLLELSGSVVTEPPYSSTKIYDYLNVYDGAGKTASVLIDAATGSVSVGPVRSTGNSMTLYFESDVSTVKAGLDLTVTLVPMDYTVTVATAPGGSMTIDKESAAVDSKVTLTATPDEGYLIDGIVVKDADNNVVALNNDIYWYCNTNTVSFKMPSASVTVTPKFSPINALSVNMPKKGSVMRCDVNIPENVTSFKIYDDGGEAGNYSNNANGEILVVFDKKSGNAGLKLSGTVSAPKDGVHLYATAMTDDAMETFYTYNGSSDGLAEDIGTFINSSSLIIEFRTGNVGSGAGLDLRVDVVKSPGAGVEVVYDDAHVIGDGKLSRWASITDGDKTSELNIPEDVAVDTITLSRKFKTDNVYNTILFPFDVKADSLDGVVKVLRFNGFKQKEDESWVVRMKRVWTKDSIGRDIDVNANTPYLVVMDDPKMVVRGGVTLKKTVEPIAMAEDCNWKFVGTLAYHEWPEGNPLVYGFSNNQFVKAGKNVSVKPLRAYLLKPEPKQASGRPSQNGSTHAYEYIAPVYIPDEFDIVEDDDETGENTTVIGRYNTRTGEFRMLPSYDIKGRKLNGKPNVHKAYYGKKVIRK